MLIVALFLVLLSNHMVREYCGEGGGRVVMGAVVRGDGD